MSNVLFPTFPGMTCSVLKTPEWDTAVQSAVSGKEVRMSNRTRPVWLLTLNFEFLRGWSAYGEYQRLLGFYNARQGAFDSFLFNDTSDNTEVQQSIGTGNGTQTTFALLHSIDTWLEPVGYAPAPNLFINGVQTSAFTCADGVNVVFNSAPASGATITWTGTFYYRVRFAKDQMEFEQFLKDFWQLKKCDFRGVI